MAEIVALYTVSRFKGEGVGTKLLARILRKRAPEDSPACLPARPKNAPRSSSLATGFRTVAPSEIPAAKWIDYDSERMQRVVVLRLEL